MISVTTSRYFVPLSLILAYVGYLLVNGALALMVKSAGFVVYPWVKRALAAANLVAQGLLIFALFWVYSYFGSSAKGKGDSSGGHKQHYYYVVPEEDLEDAPEEDSDPSPDEPTRPRKHKKPKRRASSKGGRTSSTTLPTTGTDTSSARTSNATWDNDDSLGGHGHEHGYGQQRFAAPEVDPPIAHSSCRSGKQRTSAALKGGSSSSSTIGTPSMGRIYSQPAGLALRTYLTVHTSVPTRLDPVPVSPAPKPSPLQTPAGPRLGVPEAETIPAFVPEKPGVEKRVNVGGRITQKGRSSAPYQRPSYRLARRSKRTSSPPTSDLHYAPTLPSAVSSTQDAFSPMIVEVEHDELLVLADRLELLCIASPLLPCTEKFQDAPSSPPLVEMASPIINHYWGDSMSKQTALTEPRHYARYAGLSDCEPDSDSSDDDSMDIDASDSSDDDDSMDVDPMPVGFDDVDMNAWDHPPVESPLLGNSYAPSLRYQLFGLSLAATWEDPYHDHNMLVDSY